MTTWGKWFIVWLCLAGFTVGLWIGVLIQPKQSLRYPYQLARFICYEQKERELVLVDSVVIGVKDKQMLWSFVYDSRDTLMCDSAWKAGK
jgi:hypothetical protein